MTFSRLQNTIQANLLQLGVAACLICLLSGCGGARAESQPMGAVSGTVTLKGQPLTDCRVNFISQQGGSGAGGDLQPDGSFSFEGPIPTGTYSVFITLPEIFTPAQAQSKSGLASVPKKYHSQSTSDLTATVTEGDNNLTLELK